MAENALNNDFAEFLNLLNRTGVEYLLVGGYAVAYHGYPRPTGDLDVWIRSEEANVHRVIAAVREFGFDLPQLSPELFKEGKMVRMGRPPVRLEILTAISGVSFEDAYPRRVKADFGNVVADMISLDDLKANKLAAGRLKDRADLEQLED